MNHQEVKWEEEDIFDFCPVCNKEILGLKTLCRTCKSTFNGATLNFEKYHGGGWVSFEMTTSKGEKYELSFNLADTIVRQLPKIDNTEEVKNE